MKNERLNKHLQKVGLSERAAQVYLTLLETGGSYPSTLAGLAHLNRSTVYKILTDLSVKGLVTEIERGKKLFYQAEKPEKLLRFTRDRADIAQEAYEKTSELLPELDGIFSSLPSRPVIRYFQDSHGVLSIYEDMVKEKNYEMLAFSHAGAFKKYLSPKFVEKFVEAKELNRITTRAIIPDSRENREYNQTTFTGIKKEIWPEIRFVPKEVFPFEAEVTLYGENKIAITKLLNDKSVGIVIEDKLIHDLFKMIFELLWKSDQVAM